MKTELSVGVDLDGVLSNFTKKFTEYANTLFGDRCPVMQGYDKLHWSWNFEDWYPITHEECRLVWNAIRNTENFWETLEMIPDNSWQYFKDTLHNVPNVNVYFITSREKLAGNSVVQQSIVWLKKMGWTDPQVILSDQKYDICRDMNIQFFIDDKPENIVEIKLVNKACRVYITDYLYNQSADVILKSFKGKGFKRTVGLAEFTDDIIQYMEDNRHV